MITDLNNLQTNRLVGKLAATGILLAGGQNSRMKRNKALLTLDGKPLAERSLEVLQEVFEEVLVSSNEPEQYECYGFPVVPDTIANKGPLGGLHAGLVAAKHEWCFFAACDMPFLDTGVIRYLYQLHDGVDIVVPRVGNGRHPLHAYYKKSCLPTIEKNLKVDCLKIQSLYAVCSVRQVTEEELHGFGDLARIFCNINTPEEWERVQREWK